MIRNMLSFFIPLYCLFALTFSTEPSSSQGGLSAEGDIYTWATLTNNFEDFYDGHRVWVSMLAEEAYFGWYHSTCSVSMVVNGIELFDEDNAAEYYSNGAASWAEASVDATDVENPPLNVDLPGGATTWGTLYGSTMDNPNHGEVYIDMTESL